MLSFRLLIQNRKKGVRGCYHRRQRQRRRQIEMEMDMEVCAGRTIKEDLDEFVTNKEDKEEGLISSSAVGSSSCGTDEEEEDSKEKRARSRQRRRLQRRMLRRKRWVDMKKDKICLLREHNWRRWR
ncbi:hypothetical protein LguiA_002380 [Lonicera macranthoides]